MDRIRVSEALDTGSIPVGRASFHSKTGAFFKVPVLLFTRLYVLCGFSAGGVSCPLSGAVGLPCYQGRSIFSESLTSWNPGNTRAARSGASMA